MGKIDELKKIDNRELEYMNGSNKISRIEKYKN